MESIKPEETTALLDIVADLYLAIPEKKRKQYDGHIKAITQHVNQSARVINEFVELHIEQQKIFITDYLHNEILTQRLSTL